MLESLQFVRGAVARKDHIPVLKHFQIKDGYVQSHNGVLSLKAPIACDLTIKPLATSFVHAINLCEDVVGLHETETGRLAVKSGQFKAYIETSTEEFPDIQPQGDSVEASGLLEAVKALAPIMSEDASRPWSRGILFVGQSAYVTNNIILVEHWLEKPVRQAFGLPAMAVNELLRIGEEPEGVQISDKRVTFHYEGERSLTSSLLLINQWPDVRELLQPCDPHELHDIGAEFFEALSKLRPFTKDMRPVYLEDDTMSTATDEEDGASLVLEETGGMQGTWALDQLLKLEDVADRIAWDRAPKPCPFFGGVMRGVIVGLTSAHR